MFVDYTWQDWQAETEAARPALALKIVEAYKCCTDCQRALTAADYFLGENTGIRSKKAMQLETQTDTDQRTGATVTREKTVEVKGTQIPGGFFGSFVIQQNQFLLGNGMSITAVENENGETVEDPKKRLGHGFDTTLARMGEKALTHGVCYGYWNADHLEVIPAVTDVRSGCAVLLDEMTSAPMVAVQYWQLSDKRPMYLRIFEPDGVALYRKENDGGMTAVSEKRAYVQTVRADAAGETIVGGNNYSGLPVIPLYGNEEKRSELTEAIKAKIDAYDRIISDYGDNLDRANDVYWVLNNYGGTDKDILAMLEKIRQLKAVVSMSDGMGTSSTAEPHTFEVPYQAREKALDILKRALYRDYMALDTEALTGGSLTNVAIQVAMSYINLKCDRYEWQVLSFLRQLFHLLGMEECADRVTLTRRTITNDDEIIREIYEARQDIDQRTALRLNPLINPDDVESIVEATQAERVTRAPSFEDVDRLLANQQKRLAGQQRDEEQDDPDEVTDDGAES